MTCPDCEYNKARAARWRAEAYKHAGYDMIELPWVGLTDEERNQLWRDVIKWGDPSHDDVDLMKALESKLKERNT